MGIIAADPINRFSGLNPGRVVEGLGTALQIFVPASSLLYSLCREDYVGLRYMVLALVLNQLAIESLKRLVPEKRPNGHSLSFPSGHTMAAACGASSLISRYGSSAPRIFIITQGVSVVVVGASRISSKAHWVHDVAAGALFGACLGYFLVPGFKS